MADFYCDTVNQAVQGGIPMVYFAGKRVDNSSVEDRHGTGVVEGGQQMAFFPYGEQRSGTATEVQFATYKRDSTTNLDYAHHRYYSSQIARFTTPDPKASSAHPGNPQSWNRYSYALGDPVNMTDPDGADPEFEDGEIPPIAPGIPIAEVLVKWTDYTIDGDSNPDPDPPASLGMLGNWPPDFSVTGWAPPTSGTGGGDNFSLTNYSTTSPQALLVQATLYDLFTLLPLDPKCNDWLTDNGTTIAAILGNAPSYVGVGDFSSPTTNAIAFANAPGLPPGALLTVNLNGAFFSNKVTTGYKGDIGGGSLLAEVFILLHELGHLTNAAGFQPGDGGSTPQAIANQNSNNKLVEQECAGTLNSFGGHFPVAKGSFRPGMGL